MKHRDVCTHYDNEEDRDILTRKSFDVNLRLLNSSKEYFYLIQRICHYIKWSATTKKEGYPQPKGWSGPNAGIPFRIIYVPPWGIMLNPQYQLQGNTVVTQVKSNCGSLTLAKPREITRLTSILATWWTLHGERKQETLSVETGAYTFQHECEHCDGILITSK